MQEPLTRLCARYLLRAKARGRPLDPVARFQERRLNWLGNVSAKGLADSAGLLVNYVYDPRTIERNHESYVREGSIAASAEIKRLAQ